MASETAADKVKGQLPNIGEKLEVLGEVLKEFIGETFPFIDLALKIIGVTLRDLGIVWEGADILAGDDSTDQDGSEPTNPLESLTDRLAAMDNALRELRDKLNGIGAETDAIEAKNDKLGELLGQTLVGERWVVDPRTTITAPPKVPAVSIKDEMHGIEDALAAIQNLLQGNRVDPSVGSPPFGIPANPNPGAAPGAGAVPRPWPPSGPFIAEDEDPPLVAVQSPTPPIPRLDPRLKRIYVYEQGVFTPRTDVDSRIVAIRTAAFDLSGWVDLTELRANDVVLVEVSVSVANRPHRRFSRAAFKTPGLKSFADICAGLNYISGDDVWITIRQTLSDDGFASFIDIPYQFIVESRDVGK
jgi:hypothetical protein